MSSGRRVFIGRLSNRASESDVERFFEGFGKIQEVNLKTGYGFVEFEDSRDADDAVYELNNQTLCGERVTVEHAKGVRRTRDGYGGGRSYGGGGRYSSGGYGGRDNGREYGSSRFHNGRDDRYGGGGSSGRSRGFAPPSRTKYRVIVENLSSRCSWQDLKDYLRQAGEVTFAEAHQKARNEGVVDFASYDDMKTAIDKLDNTELNGRKIRLVEEGSSYHSRSRSRSKSRSPRRSRSHSRERGNRSTSGSRSPDYQD